MSEQPLLQVHNLKTYFYTEDGVMPSVDGVDFDLHEGETLAIVGESGCGKSVTSLSIMGLVQCPPGKIEAGEILYHGKDLLKISKKEMRSIRGNEISMIFQEPMTSLNPVFTVGRQIMESFIIHQKLNKKEARTKAIEMIRMVGIPDPEKVVDKYPHELSGGMRQRIMIAMALACKPRILIADEPTTALDVTIQAQIMQRINPINKLFRVSQRFFGQYKSFIPLRWQGHVSQAVVGHRRKPYGMKELAFLQNKCHVAVRDISHQLVFVCARLIKWSAVMHWNTAAIKPAAIFIPHLSCLGL